jgi:hypothetical protein
MNRLYIVNTVFCTVRILYRQPVPSLTFQVAILPSVIVGESAGMLKFCAASEAGPAWKAASFPLAIKTFPELVESYLFSLHGFGAAAWQLAPTVYMPQRLRPWESDWPDGQS